jgi:hypothetical protein
MINLGLNKHAMLRACEFALQLRQFEKAFEFLETLHESGFPIRQHYFWPFFASSASEKGNINYILRSEPIRYACIPEFVYIELASPCTDVYDGLKCMAYLDMSPTVETLRDYVIPALLNNAKSGDSLEFILEKLGDYMKIPMSTIVPAALQFVLQKGQMAAATKFGNVLNV